MKKKFELINDKGEKLEIGGIHLLRIINSTLRNFLYLKENCKKIDKKSIFQVENSQFWLHALGSLYKYISSIDIKRELFLPCDVKVGQDGEKITIQKDSTVVFPENKHTYEEITDELSEIIKNNGLSHAKLAEILLDRISARNYPDHFQAKDKKFLDALVILMFGVESSRNNMSLVTSLLLLDLIASKQVYGSRNIPFNWKSAFVSRYNYQWDDWQHKNYGGKYPMSQHSTGTGNLGMGVYHETGVLQFGRSHVFSVVGEGYDFIPDSPDNNNTSEEQSETEPSYIYNEDTLTDIFDQYPQRHAVPRREISLIVHWLESLNDTYQADLKKAEDEEELLKRIQQIFKQRLIRSYSQNQNQNQNQNQQSFLKAPIGKDFVPLQTFSVKDIASSKIRLKHICKQEAASPDDFTDSKKHQFHRIDVACKLIPGWIANNETKKTKTKDKKDIFIKGKISGFMLLNNAVEEGKCGYCFSRPLQSTVNVSAKNTQLVAVDSQKKIHHLASTSCENVPEEKTINPNGITNQRGLVTFFGTAKHEPSNVECQQCYPPANTLS